MVLRVLAVLKGKMELVDNFRPELTRNVPAYVRSNTDTGAPGGGDKAPGISGMVQIFEHFVTCCAQPFRIVGHRAAGITVRDKDTGQSVAETFASRPGTQPVIARV